MDLETWSGARREAYDRGRRQGRQDFAENERKLLRLIELLMTYGDIKFGENAWQPGEDEEDGEEISELLNFAGDMQEARLAAGGSALNREGGSNGRADSV